jgi:hypothetical protein
MLLTFGAIELGIGFSEKGGIESASRGGARKAATLTADPADFGAQVATAVNDALDSSAVPKITVLYVYLEPAGGTPPTINSPTDCQGATDCLYFLPDSSNPKHFSTTSPMSSQNFTQAPNGCGTGPDRVTVRVVGEFDFLTDLIGTGAVTLGGSTTLEFEPTANC